MSHAFFYIYRPLATDSNTKHILLLQIKFFRVCLCMTIVLAHALNWLKPFVLLYTARKKKIGLNPIIGLFQ